ncbi:MAG: GtrA family protein, partial [Treponema sp.]|nr:GtrA family protein [Treponema sp.]
KNQEPRTKNQEPRTKNQEPRTKNQEPRTKNQEPRTKNQEHYESSLDFVKPSPGRHGFFYTIKPLIHEFSRYFLVGGLAFALDFGIFYLSGKFLFSLWAEKGILLAAALGFTAGLVFNFVLSFIFVFKNIGETAKQHKIRSFVLFVLIGITGLVITELCIFAGMRIIGQEWHIIIKIISSGIVLVWNYAARKFLVFNGSNPGGR